MSLSSAISWRAPSLASIRLRTPSLIAPATCAPPWREPANRPCRVGAGGAETLAKILVIEDDVEIAAEIAACLTAGGFESEQSHDGLQGLEAALAEPFDAITLDRLLPGCDGLGVLKGLRDAGSD